MNSTDPRPDDDWNLEDATDAADAGDVEELDIATAKRGMGPVATALVTVAVALLVVAGAGFGWWMWQNHWRQVSITVDGDQLHARADTTVAQFLKDHDSFQRKPGRLVSLKGDVLEPAGGNAVQVKLDGTAIPVSEYGSTTLARATTMTVTPGTDRTEEHTVEQRTVPFTTDINLNNGPIQVVTQQGEDGTNEIWIGKRSKQEIKKRTVEPMKKLTVQSFSPQPEGKKVIALTFDDGPSQYTGPILDILKKKKVKATFFDLGEEALAMPTLEQRMVKEGHQVASHSVSHPYLPNMSAQELRKEITTSFADLKEASGTVTRTLRAPYGAFGVQQWKDAATVLDRNVLWTIDTLDWKRPGAKAIHDEVMKNAYNGAIALMHDGGGDRTQDIQALPGIIDDLKKQGYSFVTIDELCEMGGVPKAAQGED
ncbi:polysaccharide deacetylase family protein [Bifidobacterium pseudolongum]|uniref:polysaccharide deacetylase family protein n=1 Tax=Bifidobacterium pseudolongum TaxID=1694 RepID=UPI0039936A00